MVGCYSPSSSALAPRKQKKIMSNSWVVLSELKAICSVDDFYCSVNVWLQRPNVVNKRLLGAVTVIDEKCVTISTPSGENVDELERGRQVLATLSRLYHEEMQGEACCTNSTREEAVPLKGVLRQLLPKMRSALNGWEAILFDESNHSVVFCPLCSLELLSSIPECSYRLLFSPENGQDPAHLSRYSTTSCNINYAKCVEHCMSNCGHNNH